LEDAARPPEPARDKAASDLEWPELLDRIALLSVTALGGEHIRALEPAKSKEEARSRSVLSRDALDLHRAGSPIPIVQVPDLVEVLSRLDRGSTVSGAELRDLRRLLDVAKTLRSYVASHTSERPSLAAALATSPSLDRLKDEIAGAIDDDGSVLDRASPELARARKKANDARRELVARLGDLLNRYGDVLRDRYYAEREGRYVLPVRADAPFRIDGIVLGSSASGGTLYVEPREVSELGNKRQMAEAEVEREVARVLGNLSRSAAEQGPALRDAVHATTLADVLAALARWGADAEATIIAISDADEIVLRAFRHPLLLGGQSSVVANDLELGAGRGLVISGPNAGGKTVALKCLGLAVWMASAGIPIPATTESRIGWFDAVLTDIGDEQSLARSLSTFSAHAARLGNYVREARRGALFLLDEIAAGTDPDEGAALATAVLERLVSASACVAVTTHYERLKELAVGDERFTNASVGFDFETMSPTFRVTMGIPGASSALSVAARYGVPEDVVARAAELIPAQTLRRDALLSEAESDRERARAERRAAEHDAREQNRLRMELETEVKRAREQERARLVREGTDLSSAVRDARAALRNATARLKKEGLTVEELRATAKEINAAARETAVGGRVEQATRKEVIAPAGARTPRDLSPGDLVYVKKLGTKAEVLEAPSRGEVRVAAGSMKLTVKLDDLGWAAEAERAPKPKPAKQHAPKMGRDPTPVRTPSNTVDIRGMRVDEAEERVEAFIDLLLSEGEPAGFVLHGHGTGALKSAIREHLGSHRFVARARPADEDDGGDAFTIFWIA
jgi:DNA mismatch repair protein MutS2